MLQIVSHVGYLLWQTAMSSTDEKLDALMASVSNLQRSHEQSQLELDRKLRNLEEDVEATQMDVTERAIKKSTTRPPVQVLEEGAQGAIPVQHQSGSQDRRCQQKTQQGYPTL